MRIGPRRGRRLLDDDAGIHGQRSVLVDDDGVDVQLAQLRQLAHHLRDAQQDLLQGLQIDRRRTVPFPQGLEHPGALDQAQRQERIERRQRQGPVGDELDHRPTSAERDHRPHHRIGLDSDAELAAPLLDAHGLNRHAIDAGLGLRVLHGRQHVVVGIAHPRGTADVEHHPFDVRLVTDVRGIDLERHRITQLIGNQHGLAGGSRQHRARHGDVKRRQQGLGLHLREHMATFRQHALDQQPRTFDVGLAQARQRRGGLQKQLLVLVVARNVVEGPHRRFGRSEGRNVGGVQERPARAHLLITHPAGQQRLAQAALHFGQDLGDAVAVAARHGRIDHHDTVHVAVPRTGEQSVLDLGRRGRFGEIQDGIQLRVFRHLARQILANFRVKARHLELDLVHPVRGQHRRSATVGHDGQTLADRLEPRRQALCRRKQLCEAAHPHHSGTAQHRFKHLVRTHHGAAVRGGSLCTDRSTACLHHHHRLGSRRGPQGTHETPRVADAFHAQQDAVRGRIGSEVIEHVRQVHARMRSQRDDGGKTHLVHSGPIQHGCGQSAGLRHQGQRSRCGQGTGHTGVELQVRSLKAL